MAIVTLQQVSYQIGRQQIIAPVDLAIQPSTLTGIIGRNGAGKSTLIQLIAGRLAPTAGQRHSAG